MLPFGQGKSDHDAGRPNRPPELTAVLVAPLQTDVGSSITLSAKAIDPDGDFVTLHWSGSGGKIENQRAGDATYVCETAGPHAVVVSARDAGGLSVVSAVSVLCR